MGTHVDYVRAPEAKTSHKYTLSPNGARACCLKCYTAAAYAQSALTLTDQRCESSNFKSVGNFDGVYRTELVSRSL